MPSGAALVVREASSFAGSTRLLAPPIDFIKMWVWVMFVRRHCRRVLEARPIYRSILHLLHAGWPRHGWQVWQCLLLAASGSNRCWCALSRRTGGQLYWYNHEITQVMWPWATLLSMTTLKPSPKSLIFNLCVCTSRWSPRVDGIIHNCGQTPALEVDPPELLYL